MKIIFTIDVVRLEFNLFIIRTSIFDLKKSFSYTILGLFESHSGVLGDTIGFVYITPGSCKSDNPINITGVDKLHIKRDVISGSIVKCIRESILYSFAFDKHRAIQYIKNEESNF